MNRHRTLDWFVSAFLVAVLFTSLFTPGRPAWGAAIFTFDSCNSGSMTYDSSLKGYGSGSLGLTRLTNLSGLECR